MQAFLALIVPVDSSGGGQPPGIWGGSNQPFPGYGLPGQQPPQGQPPGTWGGSGQPFPTNPIAPGGGPSQGPGFPTNPIAPGGGPSQGPGFPTPPIVIPPENPGSPPLVIWGGGNTPMPTPPIQLPGAGTAPPGGDRVQLVEWKTAWTPQTGWVVVGVPAAPHPAPSSQAGAGAAPPKR